jgi:amidase
MVAFLCIGAASSKGGAYGRTCNIATTAAKRSKPMPDEKAFCLEEATIDQLHEAIRAGRTTCVAVVQHYIDRVRAFNGVCSRLVTEDGVPVSEITGAVRATAPLRFPTETVKASTIFPNLDKYRGPPLEFGRMEPTASDPLVQQQYGMITGIPNAGQLNALATLNIRGERSVTCRGEFDRHPSEGPLPPGAPPVCEHFRQLPDALERAAEFDTAYGRNPDLGKMPMYGVVFSFKDPFDTKDMRTTAGGDAAYDIDFPARDHILVEQLRNKGAIIFAKAACTEYNGRAGDPGGRHEPEKVLPSVLGYQRSSWAGNPANPYDTTRAASLGSSSGSGVSVSANLVMVSLGEETRASTRGPANHNAVALILPHKAMLGFNGGAIGADIYCDRTGILARTIGDAAKVLDALKDPEAGYYDPRDPYTTVPRSSVLATPYASHTKPSGSLRGMRIGIIRESMLVRPGDKAAEPIATAAAAEIKAILGEKFGATLVESSDPLWERDRDLEQMNPDFRQALARLVPVFMPDLLFRLGPDGQPLFREFAAAIRPTEFAPGKVFGAGTMARSTIASSWPKRGSRRPPISTSPRSRSRSWRCLSASMSTTTCRAAPPTGANAGSPRASPTSRRSMRARNSGATTAAPVSRIGRRSPTRAIRWAGVRVWTSASCCASYCGASTRWCCSKTASTRSCACTPLCRRPRSAAPTTPWVAATTCARNRSTAPTPA